MVKSFDKMQHHTWRDWAETAALRALLGLGAALPWPHELMLMGRAARLAGRLSGQAARIDAHLQDRMPTLDGAERRRIARAVLENAGRAMAEHFSPERFQASLAAMPRSGPGWEIIDREAGHKPIILVSAHYGNFHAIRGYVAQHRTAVAGLYRPMNNAAFNHIYLDAMRRLGEPLYPRDRRGVAGMVRHLRQGGTIALLVDQHVSDGEMLDFLGRPARTALTHAELALRYNATLIPCFAPRRADGMSFDLIAESPIPHSDALRMAQAVNDRFSARIRENPSQWLWSHRRWKG